MCKCQKCGSKSKVLDTREGGSSASIQRKRECLKCGHRWCTYESEMYGLGARVAAFRNALNATTKTLRSNSQRAEDMEQELSSLSRQIADVLKEYGMEPAFELLNEHENLRAAKVAANKRSFR